ncbi:amino acid adenylation domain-containing protein [Azotobacter vinelandii]
MPCSAETGVAGEPTLARLPLSAAQLGIWLGQRLDPLSPAYWTAEAVELRGALDEAAFERALEQAVEASEALHMRFEAEGDDIWQRPDRTAWTLRRIDLSATESSAGQAWDRAWQWIRNDLRSLPDLANGPLFGMALLRLAADHHLWLLRVHHIALDGYGYALLIRRVAELYEAERQGTAMTRLPSAAGLAEVVDEARAYQRQAQRNRDFWVARLLDAPPPVTLAPGAALARDVRRRRALLPARALADWQRAAGACGVDWAAWLLAAIGGWLARRTAAPEVCLGLPVMTRLGSRALNVPCMAMNIVPLRLPVDIDRGMQALAADVAAEMRASRPHQRYRYEWLRQDLAQARRQAGRGQGLFGPVVNLMPFERPDTFGDLRARQHPVSAGPVEDLSISVVPGAEGVRLDLEANPDAYGDELLATLHEELIAALDSLQRAPATTPLRQLLREPPLARLAGEPLPPVVDVLTALGNHAARTPKAPALEQDGVRLNYAELLQAVSALAGVLVTQGVTTESRVAVLLPRSPDTVVALLAVLWAGAGYVPLDPESPEARIAMVLEDSAPTLVITCRAQRERVPAGQPVLLLDEPRPTAVVLGQPRPVAPDALAYIIYTSGTTGRPNGVMIGRDALAHFVAGARQRYAMRASDRVLQFAPLHFDASVEEIFLTLASGACLVLRNDEMLESVPRFLDACAVRDITVLDLPTAFWHELAYGLGAQTPLPPHLRLVIIGGEAALAERVQRWQAQAPAQAVLLNTYGPTETTVICTTATLSGPDALDWQGETLPIGHPLPGVEVAVVDANLRPVQRGERGELCVLGGSLARGYFGREERTAARFVALPGLPGAPRAYRTGDLVRMRDDGALVYLGRLDDEFKISGYRIDPTEIETALLSYPHTPGIREAAVLGQVLPGGVKRLVAFLALEEAQAELPPVAALRAHLARSLPAPAVPGTYLQLAKLPRNANNKIDRKVLKELAEQQAAGQTAAPGADEARDNLSVLIRQVSRVWREVLGLSDIAPDSDFFALGGESLQAIQVANRLGMLLQREVPVSSLFRYPTVGALAEALDLPVGHEPPARQDPFAPLLCLQPGEGPALFCIYPSEGLSWCYMGLAAHLPHTPIYGLQARGITGAPPDDIDALLDDCLALMRGAQPHGPYRMIGWSSGGGIAHALAARLQEAGETVDLLAMMDAYPADIWAGKPPPTERDALITLLDVIGDAPFGPDGTPLSEAQMRERLARPGSSLAAAGAADAGVLSRLADISVHSMLLYRTLRHPVFEGDVLYFFATQRKPDMPDWQLWRPYVAGRLDKVDIASTHNGMSRPLPLAQIGRALAARLYP